MNITKTNLTDIFLHSVENYPNNPALWIDGRDYSYRDLFTRGANLAKVLRNHASEQCAIFCHKNITAYISVIACILAGKTYVPLNPKLPLTRSVLMLEKSTASFIISDHANLIQLRSLLSSQQKSLLVLLPEESDLPAWASDLKNHRMLSKVELEEISSKVSGEFINNNSNAYLMFTSGTTGIPKGVMVSQRNIVSYIHSVLQRTQPHSQDRFSQVTELTFDLSIHDMFICWAVGACLYPISDKEFLNLSGFINKHQLTFWLSVPSTISLIHQLRKGNSEVMTSLRCSIFCGEALSHQLAVYWRQMAPYSTIDNFYGPTEATIAITAYRWRNDQILTDFVPIGKPFLHQAVAIVDKQLQLVPVGQIGELCLAGSQVVSGYWQDPQLTQGRFVLLPQCKASYKYWYRTGDLVFWDEVYGLIFKGRLDDQLQVKGCRVERLEIELALKTAAKSETVAVIPKYCLQNQIIVGVIGFVVNSDLSQNEIIKYCRTLLPEYLVPLEIIVLEKLPINMNGKVDYSALKALFASRGA